MEERTVAPAIVIVPADTILPVASATVNLLVSTAIPPLAFNKAANVVMPVTPRVPPTVVRPVTARVPATVTLLLNVPTPVTPRVPPIVESPVIIELPVTLELPDKNKELNCASPHGETNWLSSGVVSPVPNTD